MQIQIVTVGLSNNLLVVANTCFAEFLKQILNWQLFMLVLLCDCCKDIRRILKTINKHRTASLFGFHGHTMNHFIPCWCLLLVVSVSKKVDIP